MKIAVSSDWHGNLPKRSDRKVIEGCEALLLAGDVFANVLRWDQGIVEPVSAYLRKLSSLGIPVYMTPGNHDFHLYNGWAEDHPEHQVPKNRVEGLSELPPYSKERIEDFCGAKVLVDEEVVLNGKRIWFTPWTPEFFGWAFMLPENDLDPIYGKIPEGVDILISHGPPRYGKIDTIEKEGRECGSRCLLKAILEKEPKQVFCGHIHTGDHEETRIGNSSCFNVSLLDEFYCVRYPIKVLEI